MAMADSLGLTAICAAMSRVAHCSFLGSSRRVPLRWENALSGFLVAGPIRKRPRSKRLPHRTPAATVARDAGGASRSGGRRSRPRLNRHRAGKGTATYHRCAGSCPVPSISAANALNVCMQKWPQLLCTFSGSVVQVVTQITSEHACRHFWDFD